MPQSLDELIARLDTLLEELVRAGVEHADDIDAVAGHHRPGDDVQYVLDRLETGGGAGDLGLLLKIETRQGFENLPSILLMAMRHPKLGMMIARGDLAVEGPYILDAIRALDDILARMGDVQRKSRTLMRRIHSWEAQ